MPYFVRKIEYAKWRQRNILEGEPPSADAITNCMKTRQNTLSLWKIDNENQLEDAVLAIATAGDHIDALDLIYIDFNMIIDDLCLDDDNLGETPYEEFKDRHTDVTKLDYISLGILAESIIESLKKDQRKRFTASTLKKIIKEGIVDGKIDPERLKPNIQKKII